MNRSGLQSLCISSVSAIAPCIALTSNVLAGRLTRFDLGLLGMAASVPAIIMAFFGGVLADRIDRRRLLMATSASISALLLLLAFLDYTGHLALGHVLVIAALIGLLTGIDWPARQAIFPALIQRSQMMSAVTLNSILWQDTRMTMPALGGVIITIGGTATVFRSPQRASSACASFLPA